LAKLLHEVRHHVFSETQCRPMHLLVSINTVESDLLRWHVERHRSQVYFCVRVDTRQNEKYSCTDTE